MQKVLLHPAGMGGSRNMLTQEALAKVEEALARAGGARIPHNFEPTAAAYDPSSQQKGRMPQTQTRNPQTVALLRMLGLPYNLEEGDPMQPGGFTCFLLPLNVQKKPGGSI